MPAAATWTSLSGGRTSLAFRADSDIGSLVCKITPRGVTSPLFPIAPATEVMVLARAARHGLAPAPIAHLRDGLRDVVLHRHCDGVVAASPPPELGAGLARLHATPAGPSRPLPLHRTFAPGLVTAGLAEVARHWSRERLDVAERAVAVAMATPGAAPTLTHGDPVAANLVCSATGLMLIDWQCAGLADPVRDLAIALSPGMQQVYGTGGLTQDGAQAILESYENTTMATRLARLAPAFHAQMIGHCLWRLGQGDTAYGPAITAELAALQIAIDAT